MAINISSDAAALIKAGRKAEAQRLLEPFIEGNLHNIPAWLLEVETWPTAAEKKKVLELCLRHNPNAPQVQRALAMLETTVAPTSQDAHPKPSVLPRREARLRTNRDKIALVCALFVAVCLLAWGYLSGLSCTNATGAGACSRILFIGNSYTTANDLPNMLAELAKAGGHKVETGMVAEGGWTLSDHANSAETLDKLKSSKWDFVVLQEQSQIPAIEQSRTDSMYPAARWLVRQIEQVGATPIFFLTWARRDGWPESGLQGYENMQFQIDQGYLGIAQELSVRVAPVGYAWLIAKRQNPKLDLWQDDSSHPNEQGTYLAACVFYATIFRQSPEGLAYMGHLPKETAQILQTLAATTVLKNPKQWNLP
jgi:hypothetical protein